MKAYKILAINPGSTSTKIAVYNGNEELFEQTLRHSSEELAPFATITEQFGFRKQLVLDALEQAGVKITELDAVIGRGGVVKPIPSGIYEVNDALKHDLETGVGGQHASNLGGLIALDIATLAGVKGYIADPVVVDELQDVARVTGCPEIERQSVFHALNQKAVAREYAESKGVAYESMNIIVAHMGGGISVGAHRKGQVVDVNNALDGDGPLTPERAGTLPAGQLVRLAMSGKYSADQMKKMITGKGGMVAYIGSNDLRDVIALADKGNGKAKLLLDAMCYNVGKSIGAAAAVLHGKVDAIILTGGIAYSDRVCVYIEEMVDFIAPVVRVPGENEMQALAANAARVLAGTETAKVYL